MKMSALILCVLGVVFLFVGSVLTVEANFGGYSVTIPSYGRIAGNSEESQSQPVNNITQLDKIGYLIIFASVGFFAVAFLHNRKSTEKQK